MAPARGDGSGGELVEVAAARDAFQAGMLKGLLHDAGIPCMTRGYGVDGQLLGFGLLTQGGGPQQVLVHADRLEEARTVLAEVLAADDDPTTDAIAASERRLEYSGPGRKPRDYGLLGAYARIYLFSLLALAAMAGLYFLGRAL